MEYGLGGPRGGRRRSRRRGVGRHRPRPPARRLPRHTSGVARARRGSEGRGQSCGGRRRGRGEEVCSRLHRRWEGVILDAYSASLLRGFLFFFFLYQSNGYAGSTEFSRCAWVVCTRFSSLCLYWIIFR